jgi:hypothetical protein
MFKKLTNRFLGKLTEELDKEIADGIASDDAKLIPGPGTRPRYISPREQRATSHRTARASAGSNGINASRCSDQQAAEVNEKLNEYLNR